MLARSGEAYRGANALVMAMLLLVLAFGGGLTTQALAEPPAETDTAGDVSTVVEDAGALSDESESEAAAEVAQEPQVAENAGSEEAEPTDEPESEVAANSDWELQAAEETSFSSLGSASKVHWALLTSSRSGSMKR